jgi:hypothetical protein
MSTHTINTSTTVDYTLSGSDSLIITTSGTIQSPNGLTINTTNINSFVDNSGNIDGNVTGSVKFTNSTFGVLTNYNSIVTFGTYGIRVENNSSLATISNKNNSIITGNSTGISVLNSTVQNIENIYTITGSLYGIDIENSTVNNIINNYQITATNNFLSNNYGIYIKNSNIDFLTNTGTISSSGSGTSIYTDSNSTVNNLNNLQSDLKYTGKLPTNYNIIINNISNYGKIIKNGVNPLSNSINFDIFTSSILTLGTYIGVLQGFTEANVDIDSRNGTFDSFAWELINVDTETGQWDLIVTELPSSLPINPACWPQIGGPQPPRLWSRDQESCIETTPQLTQYDLDMRRKAEILKYKANSAQLTKKQQWSQNVRGAGPNGKRVWANQNVYGSNPNTQNLPRIGNTLQLPCVNNNGITCSPSYASDVPGPAIQLCYNPNIPLVNYKVQRTYLSGGTKWPQIGSGPKPI